MTEIDLTEHAELIQAEKDADLARLFHKAEADKYTRIRDGHRAQLAQIMGMHDVGLINGVPVVKKTLSEQFAPAQFKQAFPDIYNDYLVPKLDYVLDMDKLRKDLPYMVAKFSTVRWTNKPEVLG